jgi:hypothetical protein
LRRPPARGGPRRGTRRLPAVLPVAFAAAVAAAALLAAPGLRGEASQAAPPSAAAQTPADSPVAAAPPAAAPGSGAPASPAPGGVPPAPEGAPPAAATPLTADAWMTRIAEALRIGDTMSAKAHVDVDRPGRSEDFAFDMEMLRGTENGVVRTVMQMQEVGDKNSIVSELVDEPGQPLTSWYWDLRKRRWLAVRGLLPTDPWADTGFRYEDLWLTEPKLRRKGEAHWVEEGGRHWIELWSEPYHYYQRVETRVDPVTGLPVRVRFIDNTGAPIREQRYENVTLVDGRPFPSVVRLRDLMAGGETTVTFGEVRFGRRIPPSFFDRSVMDERIRRGIDPVPEPPDRY